jgi:hypothetical protein
MPGVIGFIQAVVMEMTISLDLSPMAEKLDLLIKPSKFGKEQISFNFRKFIALLITNHVESNLIK